MLTGVEVQLLEVWKRWPLDSQRDRRGNAYAELGLSETRAVQVVNGLIGCREAWELDPVTVARLSRLRAARSHSGR